MTAPRDAMPPEWAMKEADAIDLCGYDHDRTCCLETREEIARALAAAYARGQEDAAKMDVGLIQQVANLARRVAALEADRASSTAAAPHNAAKTGLFP